MRRKLMMIGADIDFLKKCLKIVHITEPLYNNRSKSAVDAAKNLRLNKETQHHIARKDNTNLKLYNLHISLTDGLSDCSNGFDRDRAEATQLNYVHHIFGVESALKLIPYEERTCIRSRCKTLLEHSRRNKKLTSPVAPDLK
jgi:hypothetical protein